MNQERDYDVVILGAGASGISAAIAAAESGSRVVVVERGPLPGGELIGGLSILGCSNGAGEWIVKGILSRLLDQVRSLGGYVGFHFDWRTMWGACFDPELMKVAVIDALRAAGVELRLATLAVGVERGGDSSISALVVHDGRREQRLTGRVFIDASGDGWLAEHAGAEMEEADGASGFQPISMTFRLAGVDFPELLEFIRANPDDLIVAENPFITATKAEAAVHVAESGVPFVAIGSQEPESRLRRAIDEDRMFPTTAFYMWPTSLQRNEVGLNVTRISRVDGADMQAVSRALPTLTDQVLKARSFLVSEIPGFAEASISSIAPRVGVRETKRIVGLVELTTDDVLTARKRDDGVARGSHHIDIHGEGSFQLRRYIPDGGSYDIPMGSLIPGGLDNLVVAGRCIAASREASGSARVIGSCIATGEAAGVMAALAIRTAVNDVRLLPVGEVRSQLKSRGALVEAEVA